MLGQQPNIFRETIMLALLVVGVIIIPVSVSLSVTIFLGHRLNDTCWFLNLDYKGDTRCCCWPHGQGTITWPKSNNTLKGTWVNGRIHPREMAVMTSVKGGFTYTGQLKNKRHHKHGKGIQVWDNGSFYDGQWKDNQQHGKGTFTWSNQNSYTGQWENNCRSGYGVMTWHRKKEVYKGYWKNNLRNGKGEMEWHRTGEKYDGEWKNSKKHGQGILTRSNGSVLRGEWTNDKLCKIYPPVNHFYDDKPYAL